MRLAAAHSAKLSHAGYGTRRGERSWCLWLPLRMGSGRLVENVSFRVFEPWARCFHPVKRIGPLLSGAWAWARECTSPPGQGSGSEVLSPGLASTFPRLGSVRFASSLLSQLCSPAQWEALFPTCAGLTGRIPSSPAESCCCCGWAGAGGACVLGQPPPLILSAPVPLLCSAHPTSRLAFAPGAPCLFRPSLLHHPVRACGLTAIQLLGFPSGGICVLSSRSSPASPCGLPSANSSSPE